jgi:putative ABC transport system permease protein
VALVAVVEGLAQDLRFALRQLARSPVFTLAAMATLSLGIGINTAAFTVYESVALKPLAAHAPRELVRVIATQDQTPVDLPYAAFESIQRDARSLRGLLATSGPQQLVVRLSEETESRALTGRFVSDEYFSVLGVSPELGRTFAPGDENVVVLSDDTWRRLFNADANVVGKTLTAQGIPLVIVGVTSPAFGGTGSPPSVPDCWIPLSLQRALLPAVDWIHDPTQHPWQVLARLAPGVNLAQASAELAVLAPRLAPIDGKPVALTARRATFFQTDSGEFAVFGSVSRIVMVAVGLLLLIGCMNLVTLLAARNATRGRELTMRLALGASRGRIARLLIAESALLGLGGGAGGLLLSWWLCHGLHEWVLRTLARVTGEPAGLFLNLSVDTRVLAYTAVLSLVVGVAVGVSPALRAARADVGAILKQGSTGTEGPGIWRQRYWLLTAQIALCLVLLTAGGLLVSGVRRSRRVDPGFDVGHVLLLWLDPAAQPPTAAGRMALYDDLARRLALLPDVKAVAWSSYVPFVGHSLRTFSAADGVRHTFAINQVSSDYLAAVGIPLVAGRTFSAREVEQGSPVVIISEAVARRYWPGADPVGKTLADYPWLAGPDSAPYTVIGVAKDVRGTYLSRVDEGYEYFPQPLAQARGMFVIGTRGRPEDAGHAVLTTLSGIDPLLPSQVRLMPLATGPLELQRLLAGLPGAVASTLALLGLLLASVGLFGLVSQVVARRVREIGIRMALGARQDQVVALVLRTTLRPVGWGVALGLCGAVAVSGLLAWLLVLPDMPDLTYGGGAFNPLVFAAVLGVLLGVVAVAAIIPARRATQVDPVQALRQE